MFYYSFEICIKNYIKIVKSSDFANFNKKNKKLLKIAGLINTKI